MPSDRLPKSNITPGQKNAEIEAVDRMNQNARDRKNISGIELGQAASQLAFALATALVDLNNRVATNPTYKNLDEGEVNLLLTKELLLTIGTFGESLPENLRTAIQNVTDVAENLPTKE